MLGTEQRVEGGCESDHRRKRLRRCSSVQHMRSVPVLVTTTTTTRTLSEGEGESTIVSISAESFRKDGRVISVGDCALFKPAQDCPPFIGIIRQLLNSKEANLQLRVDWLYRPAELILGKGILLDAAPNEIFYSFHKDEIPAASLLHPCRVAFLPKGVELPSGVSSFVCRRVYDIENKCLWWLNDQDYIDELQEELDKLLYRTRTEMHGNVQSGGRSPKPVNGPTSTSQSRPGSESMHNMGSFPSQVKGKKRERVDQGSDHVKRERVIKTDDVDSALSRTESSVKSEIARVTDKGGLVDSEGVEKIVHLMQPDKMEKKMDLMTRSMLAGVIAATDKFDCLNRFVQLRGLPVLDEWLQDIHKGKIGDCSNSKDGDHKSTEFLLVLLRALEKLPVNLNALQTCNIGRSVNHLRSHKNTEIQKKARSLVDTWKKRVEAEMNIIDAKSGSNQTVSWSSKSRLPETHGGNRNTVGPGDVTARSSVTQVSASKISSNKPSPVETTKAATSSPGPGKSSSPVSVKENHPKTVGGGTCDAPLSSREDKSSSSSQSHNYSHSVSCKEDAKSCAGSVSFSKVSSGGSRHRKSNGFPGTSVTGGQKDSGSSRTSLQRSTNTGKVSHNGLTGEKSLDVPVIEGSSHKLIVKIPNRVRSPAQSANGGPFEDPSVMSSRASSPVLSDKHEKYESNLKDRSDTYKSSLLSDVNAESWQSNDFKDALVGSRDGDGSPAALPDGEIKAAEDVRKAADTSKAASSSSGNAVKSGKLHDASFRSMNALIESCVKYSEGNPSMSIGDDVGMNLLASVATGEMSKSDLVSPADSPQRSTSAAERTSAGDDARSKQSRGDNVPDGPGPNKIHGDDKKYIVASDSKWIKDDALQVMHALPGLSGERNTGLFSSEEKLAGESNPSSTDLQMNAERCMEGAERIDAIKNVSSSPRSMGDKRKEDKQNRQLHDQNAVSSTVADDGTSDAKLRVNGSSAHDMKVPLDVDVKQKEDVSRNDGDGRPESNNELSSKSPLVVTNGEVLPCPVARKDLVPDSVDGLNVGGSKGSGSGDLVDDSERQSCVQDTNTTPVVEDRNTVAMDTEVTDGKTGCPESKDENKEVLDNRSCIASQKETPTYAAHDIQKHAGVGESKQPCLGVDGEKSTSTKAEGSSPSVVGEPKSDSKIEFDLNEGFTTDDGKCGESVLVAGPACPSNTGLVNPLPFAAATSVSTSLPAPVTVAAAAKGPFLPPEDLLRSKGELGWKGSAATSAFRPAEPRKSLLTQSVSLSSSPDVSASKSGRVPLDIDLNVPDERVLEDLALRDSATDVGSSSDFRSNCDFSRNDVTGAAPVRSSGGLDLDLNRSDDSSDVEQYLLSSSRRPEPPAMPAKSLSGGGLSTSELRRDFDLNNGPCVEDANTESSFTQHIRGSIHTQPPVAGLRMSNADIGNFSSWFPPGNSYSTVTIPSILPERGQQGFPMIPPGASHRILGPANTPFPPDVYRGSVLSSSPSVPFPSNPFPYPVYPFGTTFPLPSATYSIGSTSFIDSSAGGRLFTQSANSQLPGPVDAVSSHYPRHYVVSLPENSRVSSAENNRKWARQGLDLNAGPGGLDAEGREAMLPIMSMQPSVAGSQSLTDEQARMFALGGAVLKRKEPDSAFDNENFRYKQQSSWQ